MKPYSLDLRKKIVESVKKGVPKAERARRFGVDRATVKRYCKQLDERGTLQARKAPGKSELLPHLDIAVRDDAGRAIGEEDGRGVVAVGLAEELAWRQGDDFCDYTSRSGLQPLALWENSEAKRPSRQ